MTAIRDGLERFFSCIARIFIENKVKALTVFVLFFLLLASQLKYLRIDTSVESFFYQSDKSLVDYMAFKDQFGRDDYVVIGIKTESVFTLDFLDQLRQLHIELEENVPHLYEIDSLLNARHTEGKDDVIVVEDLLEEWPETKNDLDLLKSKVMSNPFYLNSIISEDGRMTALLLESELLSADARNNEESLSFTSTVQEHTSTNQLTEAERSEFVLAIKNICNKFENENFKIFITGSPVLAHEFRVTMVKENQLFLPLVISMLVTFLFLMFRRVSGVIIPLLVVILSTLATMAIMSVLDFPFTLASQILPTFILVVGVGDSVHILALFFHRFNKSGHKAEALVSAMGQSGVAIFLTSITTAAGLLSFTTSEMPPIAHLGITGAIGVIMAFLVSIVLCPCLIGLIPLKVKKQKKSNGQRDILESILLALGRFSIHKWKAVLVVNILILMVAIFGITKLRFAHNDLEAFSQEGEFYIDSKTIDQELKGSVVLEVVLDTAEENGLYDPVLLKKIDSAQRQIEEMSFGDMDIDKTFSITDIVKETNKALNNNEPAAYAIPDNRQLVAQELFLFENGGSDDLEKVTDSLFSKARLTVKAPFSDAWNYVSLIEAVSNLLEKEFPETEFSTTGLMILFAGVLKSTIISMAESYLLVFVVISILMVVLIGRVRIGLISMIPNIYPVVLILGIMGLIDQPLDFFNITIGSILVGIAVDDTIHFFHHFRANLETNGGVEEAIIGTFLSTGRAMITTTIVLCCGFFVYAGSDMTSLFYYGVLIGIGVFLALLSDFLLAPALLMAFGKKSLEKSAHLAQPQAKQGA